VSLTPPPRWTTEEFKEQCEQARQIFRTRRLNESRGLYSETFVKCLHLVKELLEKTDGLSQVAAISADEEAPGPDLFETLTDTDLLETLRYVIGPPISADDLAELADTSLAPRVLFEDTEASIRVAETVIQGLDPIRFPWVGQSRQPGHSELDAAALATAALMATRRVETARRMQSKEQEEAVKSCLREAGVNEVEPRTVSPGLLNAPEPGEFCRKAKFGTRKADLIVRLHDGRCMPIECKVSNSSTNSVKRLNNDAAAKASTWIEEFGSGATVPSAVLAGIFKTLNLEQAQAQHLTTFWAHNLDPLTSFIRCTEQST